MEETLIGPFKVNWDAAYNMEKKNLILGAIIRNEEGLVIGTLRVTRSYNNNPFTVETYKLLLASQFCKDVDLHTLIIEGDSL